MIKDDFFKTIKIVNKKIDQEKYSFHTISNFKMNLLIYAKSKNLKIIIIYLIGIIFYLCSLTHINGVDLRCFKWNGVQCYYSLAILTLFSSIFISISIYMIIFMRFRKIHLLFILIIYIFLFFIDHKDGLQQHGFFNFIGFTITTFFFLFLFCLMKFLSYLYKKKNYLLLIIFLISGLSIFISLKIFERNNFNCENWKKGLNNSFIDNESKDFPCNIKIPKQHSCYLTEIGPYFDFTKKYKPSCLENKTLENERKKFSMNFENLNYYKISKKNHFGFPLTNNDDFNPYDFGTLVYNGNKSFESSLYNNIIFMDLYNTNKTKYYPNIERPEIEIYFEGEKGKLIINVHKNQSLINEKEELLRQNKNRLIYKNILVIFFDTVSRAHFFRKFPKTIKFFNKFTKYEKNSQKKNMTIFQYFKYHSLNTYTDPNILAAYYGTTLYGNGTHFADYFKNNGFIIGRANNFCGKESAINLKNPKALKHAHWDHEGLSIACIKELYLGVFTHKMSSLVKRCLFGKDLNEYILEYIESFWLNYIDQHKLFLYQNIEGHEPTGELIGHFDDIFYHFLKKFYSNGWLKNTTILIFSDHGQHLNGPLYLFNSQDFFFERTLATLFLIIPNNDELYKNNLYEIMKSNQQTFVTPFDIYNTLIYLSNYENYKNNSVSYGVSLFEKINYKERYCQSKIYEFQNESQINPIYCSCIINGKKE